MGDEVGGARDQDEREHRARRGQAEPPLLALPIGLGHNPGNAHEDRHAGELPELVHRVERGVEHFGDHQCPAGQAEREDESHHEQLEAIGGSRGVGRDGRVQDPELLSLLPLLHALGELRLLVPLPERLVELLGRVVVPGELLELLLALGRALESGLISRDGGPKTLLLGFENLGFRLGGAERFPQAHHVGVRQARGHARSRARRVGRLTLRGRHFRFETDHGGVFLREASSRARQLLAEPVEAHRPWFGGGSG